MSGFEYNEDKSQFNQVKHGIDFQKAQRLWDDPNLLEIPARTADEPRYACFGMLDGKHWTAVVTYREENIRIISVRRSRDREVELYESQRI